jgi:DNA topoisomerase-3
MKVIVAEKPSVAREIASFVKAKTRLDGYFEGNGYQVTWALGHLVTLKEPDEYDPALKKWSLQTLPFIPENFQLKLIQSPAVVKQFKILQKLMKSGSELIAATDAGREGELIFRYILSLTGLEQKPFQRLWLSSLTEESIAKAFQSLRPGSDYNALYQAAKCRSESDWIVGLNATRNFTVRYGRGGILWSVGRVQTPVLAMIAAREEEITSFTSKPFWEVKTKYRDVAFSWKGERFLEESKAQDVLQKIQDQPFTVLDVESKQEKIHPPFLYDLTELQKDMNKRYGLSAQETLEQAQKLYEDKCISYPRTDSKYLSSDMKKEMPSILQSLAKAKPQEIESLDLQKLTYSAKIFSDEKVTDHHAIIPTGNIPGTPSKLWEAIALRFIAAFYPPCIKNVTTVEGETAKERFVVKGSQILSPGWTTVLEKEKSKEEDMLPLFTPEETGPHKPFVQEGKTEPPKHYTEATVLHAMETAGKKVEEEHLKEALKQKGLGTPATRAAILETLLKRNYIVREKKNIKITDLGRYLIALVQDPHLKSPELTGEWEAKLKEIEQGKFSAERFMQEIAEYTKEIIHKSDFPPIDQNHLGKCPLCQKPVIEGKKGYGCSGWKEGCSFVIWKEYKQVPITVHQVRRLLQHKILQEPLLISSEKVILYLSAQGVLREVSLQESQSKEKGYVPNDKKTSRFRSSKKKKEN